MIPEPGDAREGLVQRAVGGGLAERSTAAEALRGDVDDVGAEAAHVLVVEAPLADHVATVVLDDDVSRGAEAERQLAAARGTEIERDAQLPARGVVEGPRAVDGVGLDRDAAEEVDVGARLDLDDLGAELGEQRPGLGDGNPTAEVDHAEPGERGTLRAVAARAPGRPRREAPLARGTGRRRGAAAHRARAREVEGRGCEGRVAQVREARLLEVA